MYSLLHCGLEIRLKVKCATIEHKSNLFNSDSRKASVLANERSELELKLDIEEFQELHAMCTQSSVRTFVSQFVTRLETLFEKIPLYSKSRITEEIKWSDIVAGRHSNIPGINPTTDQSIETVITSKPTHYYNRTCASITNRTTQLQSAREDSMNRQDGRSRDIILGDSHARGIASELLQQSNHQFHTTGYVKPKARLPELLWTAKSELNKLSSKDTVIVIGGSNDIGKSDLNSNLTSIVKFLDDLQPTNVILADSPLGYDIGATIHISYQIK